MGLEEALAANKTSRKGPVCSICFVISRMPEGDRVVLAQAFDDDTFTSAAITRALKAEGHEVSTHSVARHRRGECSRESR